MNRNAIRLASVLVFVVIWEASVRLGWVKPFLVASPSMVAGEMAELTTSGVLPGHVWASMVRVLSGYLIALVTGVVLGGLMGWFRVLDDIIDPLVELFRPVSPLAILPLAILWLGIGQASKIFIVWYACFFPVLINTYAGVRAVARSSVEAALTLGAKPDEMLRYVVFFNSLPMIMTGARISFAVGMIVIIASEMVASNQGLGYMILTAQQTFRTTELYVGIVTIALVGFIGDRILRLLRSRLCPWYVEVDSSAGGKQGP